jgi:ribosome-associated translation inhibitor RaiA
MEKLSITIKTIGSNQFEMHAKLVAGGEIFNSEVTDHNLFVIIDKLLKKIESSALK